MIPFRSTAVNEQGLRFLFHFNSLGWKDIQDDADARLAEIVSKDEFHKKHGPWKATQIDVGY